MKTLLEPSVRSPIGHRSLRPGAARILHAEDEPAIRRLTAKVLTEQGHAVTSVADGERAWEALQTGFFDLLITDNDMPGLSGLELIERVRRHGMDLPVVMVSGLPGWATKADLDQLHLAAALPKPFALEDLRRTVNRVLAEPVEAVAGRDGSLSGFDDLPPVAGPIRHWGINE